MTTPDPRMASYLLGELSEAEATAFEREFFVNPDVFTRLVEVETGLVDDYVRRRLPPQVGARFEQHYLADPRRRARVEFAEALAAKIDEAHPAAAMDQRRNAEPARIDTPETRKWLWWASMAAVLAVSIASTGWLWLQSRRLRGELAHAEVARASVEQRARDLQDQLSRTQTSMRELAGELERLQTPSDHPDSPSAPSFVSLLLAVPSARAPDAAAAPTLTIPTGTRQVRFELAIPDAEYASYQVAVNPVAGAAVFTRQRLVPRTVGAGVRIVVTAPANRLVAGDYMLTLTGERSGVPAETVSQLLFRVVVTSRSR